MKILAFADIHLGNYKYPIKKHILAAMRDVLLIAEIEKPDVIVFAGDAFRWKVPPAEDLSAMGDFLYNLSLIAPVIIVAGNHDMLGSGVSTLDAYDNYDNVFLFTEPTVFQMKDVQFVLVPWLPQKSLSNYGQPTDDTAGIQRALVHLLKAQLVPDKPAILVGHLTALGAKYKEGVSSVVGSDVTWTNDLFEGFDVSILGHLHKPQTVNGNIVYTGSICPVSFNETEQEKRVILWEDGHIHSEKIPGVPKFAIARLYIDLPNGIDKDYSNYFLLIHKKEDQEDPEVPECLWYEIRTVPHERQHRVRIDLSAEMSVEEVITRWLELEGYGERTEEVLQEIRRLLE